MLTICVTLKSRETMDGSVEFMETLPPTNDGVRLPQVHYVNSDHLGSAFAAMNSMRQNNQLCDISLEVLDNSTARSLTPNGSVVQSMTSSAPTVPSVPPVSIRQIRAHKVVLAAASAYFNAMFNTEMAERNKTVITLHDLDMTALNLLVDYAYTGQICITEENVQSLLPAASLLQVSSVREACCKFLLRQLHPSNCLGIRSFADAHSCEELQSTSHKYALENFQEVAQTEEFLLLPFNEVENLIASNQLNICNEEIVYGAAMAWVKHDMKEREQHLGSLLYHVRLPLMERTFLLEEVSKEPLIKSNQTGKDLLIEAMIYHLSPEHRRAMSSVRTQQRTPDGLRPYIFSIGGGSLFAIHNECEYYNPRLDHWGSLAPTSQRRSRAGVVALNRLVFAVGGYNGTKDLSSAEFYDPLFNKWTNIKHMGTKRSCLGVAALNGLIYVAGGYDGASCLNSVERYDPLVAEWSSVQAMETRRRYCRLSVLDGCLYAVGGYDGSNYQSSVERFDPREGKWQTIPAMINRRSSCGVAALDRMLYVVGGNDGSLCMCSAERFDPVRNAWESVPSMHSRRSTHEVVEAQGLLYAIGGNDGSSSLNTVETYDPLTSKWTLVSSMMLRRSSVGATVLECPVLEDIFTTKTHEITASNNTSLSNSTISTSTES
ncbi:kelch-like protein 17 isoform X2 [Oppia nitens]|uniref:kelch-like protein 17 isoform X2 n=1 Tax=Oppia nitens TaxID=1686743 RepID=UPI0023DA74CE|nr:kelch-like protein 17 isoform X2 [Oppia nitens]